MGNQIIDCGLFNLSENWTIMLRGIFFLLTIQLFIIFLNTDRVQAGIANETSDPIVLRSGVDLKELDNETVLRAAAQTSIQDCLCQCHWQTFRDRYGRTHGNCMSTDQTGGRWCYIRTPVITNFGDHGYSTCSDQERSGRYPGMTWSYQACATPTLKSSECTYLLYNHRQTNNAVYKNSIKPRVGENSNEGYFRDENGTIKKGTKWVKFPSVITLGESRPQLEEDGVIGGNG